MYTYLVTSNCQQLLGWFTEPKIKYLKRKKRPHWKHLLRIMVNCKIMLPAGCPQTLERPVKTIAYSDICLAMSARLHGLFFHREFPPPTHTHIHTHLPDNIPVDNIPELKMFALVSHAIYSIIWSNIGTPNITSLDESASKMSSMTKNTKYTCHLW